MSLTPEQKVTLKSHILATPALEAIYTNGDLTGLEAALNADAAPAFVVWKTSVTWDEIMLNGMDWARVDNLSVGKARIWDWMFQNSSRSMNPSKANIQAGINAVWVGTAADIAVRDSVYTHCKRNATVTEKLFATGTGNVASPAIMAFEGFVSTFDLIGL